MKIISIRSSDERGLSEQRELVKYGIVSQLERFSNMGPDKSVKPLDLIPVRQASTDTCLLACAISVKRAMAQRSGKKSLLNESVLARSARSSGLLVNGGMLPDQRTIDFLSSQLGFSSQVVNGTSIEKLDCIVDALRQGSVPLLSYDMGNISHWVALQGVSRDEAGQTVVQVMNPLNSGTLQNLTLDDFAEKLMGGENTGGGGVSSGLIVVQVPEELKHISDSSRAFNVMSPVRTIG